MAEPSVGASRNWGDQGGSPRSRCDGGGLGAGFTFRRWAGSLPGVLPGGCESLRRPLFGGGLTSGSSTCRAPHHSQESDWAQSCDSQHSGRALSRSSQAKTEPASKRPHGDDDRRGPTASVRDPQHFVVSDQWQERCIEHAQHDDDCTRPLPQKQRRAVAVHAALPSLPTRIGASWRPRSVSTSAGYGVWGVSTAAGTG